MVTGQASAPEPAWRCPEHDSECIVCREFGCDYCDREIEREAHRDV